MNVTRKNDFECTISGGEEITVGWLRKFLELIEDRDADTPVVFLEMYGGEQVSAKVEGIAIRDVVNDFEPTTQSKPEFCDCGTGPVLQIGSGTTCQVCGLEANPADLPTDPRKF